MGVSIPPEPERVAPTWRLHCEAGAARGMLASRFKRPEGSPKAVLLERGQGWQAQARPSPQVAMEGDAFLLAVARWHDFHEFG